MAIAAIGQICSTASMAHNLEQCVKLISKAAAAGAKVLFLPEASDYIASSAQESLSLAKPMTQSPFVLGLQSAAKQHRLAVNVGIHEPVSVRPSAVGSGANPVVPTQPEPPSSSSLSARTDEKDVDGSGGGGDASPMTKLLNRTIWITAEGALHAPGQYDKLHLFDYPAGGLRESAGTQAGAALTPPFDTPVGRVGSLVCFDVRFPEPSARLAHPGPAAAAAGFRPAHLLAYPSAFTVPTGRAHWEVLLRARAIEGQCFVVAAAQCGTHHHGRRDGGGGAAATARTSYGHSLAVGPWGTVLCRLGGVGEDGTVEEGAVGALGLVDIDLAEWERVRERMPLVRRT